MTKAAPAAGDPPPPPPDAASFFPDADGRGELARRYARWLAGPGVQRGLLGPREVPRLWDRHLLNCAAVGELLTDVDRIVDIGAGAGLPGLVLAIACPSLRVDLVEPLQRRIDFLQEVVSDLSMAGRVRVIRGRAEESAVRAEVGGTPRVVVRAVASLEKLVQWCLPLLEPDGRLLALKGQRAQEEVDALSKRTRQRVGRISVVDCGRGLATPTRVVIVQTRQGR